MVRSSFRVWRGWSSGSVWKVWVSDRLMVRQDVHLNGTGRGAGFIPATLLSWDYLLTNRFIVPRNVHLDAYIGGALD